MLFACSANAAFESRVPSKFVGGDTAGFLDRDKEVVSRNGQRNGSVTCAAQWLSVEHGVPFPGKGKKASEIRHFFDDSESVYRKLIF